MTRIIILSFILLISCKKSNIKAYNIDEVSTKTGVEVKRNTASTTDWNGKWIYKKNANNSDVPEQQFTLTIVQDGNKIKAQYCAIANSGGKIDCESEKIYNVEGKIVGNKVIGKFFSFFGSEKNKGEFELLMNSNNSLAWKITTPPNDTFYAPDECILQSIEIEKPVENEEVHKEDKIFPISSENIEGKINFETTEDDAIKNSFKQKFQLNVDALAKLPSQGDYGIYLIKNVSGESDLTYLVTTKKGNIIDGLEIENSNADNETETVFSIDSNYNVSTYLKNNDNKKIVDIYTLKSNGQIAKK